MSMKAMLSQPMAGLTDEQIAAARDKAIAALEAMGYEVVNTLFTDAQYAEWTENNDVRNVPVMYLAQSIKNMSLCDAAYFVPGWDKARGCRIEHDVARAYGLAIIYGKED